MIAVISELVSALGVMSATFSDKPNRAAKVKQILEEHCRPEIHGEILARIQVPTSTAPGFPTSGFVH